MFHRLARIGFILACVQLCGCGKNAEPEPANGAKGAETIASEPVGTSSDSAPPKAAPVVEAVKPEQIIAKDRAEPTPAAPGPRTPARWRCEEPEHDFGKVWAGAVVTHTFEFENIGGAALKILQAKPRCSCSVADNYTRVVEPGGTGVVPFRLNTANKSGEVNEWLTIQMNVLSNPTMTLRMKGQVKRVCRLDVIADASVTEGKLSPAEIQRMRNRQAFFGTIAADDRLDRTIKMTNTASMDLTLDLQQIRPPDAPFKVSFKEIVANRTWELHIEGESPFPPGRTSASIPFRTNIPDQEIFYVTASAYVPPRVEVIPDRIVADRRSFHIKQRTIRINNNGDTPFQVTSIAASSPEYKLALKPQDSRKPKQILIEVILPPGEYRPPAYGEVIRIETTDAEHPVIELYVLPELRMTRSSRPSDKPLKFYPAPMSED